MTTLNRPTLETTNDGPTLESTRPQTWELVRYLGLVALFGLSAFSCAGEIDDAEPDENDDRIAVLSSGDCPWEPDDWAYCRDCGPCAEGVGDCDKDAECETGLYCDHRPGLDLCEAAACPWPEDHFRYCQDCGPCSEGVGDCDNDDECETGLYCDQKPGVDYCEASEILYPTPIAGSGSVLDAPIGLPAEQVFAAAFVFLNTNKEHRAFIEFDVSSANGAALTRAELNGRIAANNSLSTGPRIIEISIFDADGDVELQDFDGPTSQLGTVTYAPPTQSGVNFSYDILARAQSLIDGGATHIGVRARSTVNDAANVLTGVELVLAQ